MSPILPHSLVLFSAANESFSLCKVIDDLKSVEVETQEDIGTYVCPPQLLPLCVYHLSLISLSPTLSPFLLTQDDEIQASEDRIKELSAEVGVATD